MNTLYSRLKDIYTPRQNKPTGYERLDELEYQIAELKGKISSARAVLLRQENKRNTLLSLSDQLDQEAYKSKGSANINSLLEEILEVRRQIREIETTIANTERDISIIQALHDNTVREYKSIKEQIEGESLQTALCESMCVLSNSY